MKAAVSCLYASYGRYIDGHRAIPSNIDALKLSHRRSLMSLFDVAKDKYVKSAKVVGYIIGNFHPHGDLSAYQTVFTLVMQGFVDPGGSWGSRGMDGTDNPSAMRYTECRLSKWVKELAFQYVNYVPWENFELENEPLYLPAPIPIGLIGTDNISGIAFHTTMIPKYKKTDLAKRLKWIIENYETYPNFDNYNESSDFNENKLGPEIKPNFRDCKCKEDNPGDFYKLLYKGVGKIRAIPNGCIKGNNIYIQGKAPFNTFEKLKNNIDDKKLDVTLTDYSANGDDPYSINGEIKPRKKLSQKELKTLFTNIWKDYLVKSFNYRCYFVDENHIPEIYGIDQILINNYERYVNAVLKYRIEVFENLNNKLFHNHIILIIKNLIDNNKIGSIKDLINTYNQIYKGVQHVNLEKIENDSFVTYKKQITEDDIKDTCNKRSITKLIQVKIDLNQIKQDILDAKKSIDDINEDCLKKVENLISS